MHNPSNSQNDRRASRLLVPTVVLHATCCGEQAQEPCAGHRLTQTHMAQRHLVPDSCRVHGKPSVPTPQLPTLGMG